MSGLGLQVEGLGSTWHEMGFMILMCLESSAFSRPRFHKQKKPLPPNTLSVLRTIQPGSMDLELPVVSIEVPPFEYLNYQVHDQDPVR